MTEIVYLTHDNTVDLLLKADGEAQDLSAVTRMTLDFDGTVIDSDTTPAAFDWDVGVTGKLVLALGGQSTTAGFYRRVRLVVYDPSNTSGVVWGHFDCEVST